MGKIIKKLSDVHLSTFYDIDIEPFWNLGTKKEQKIHRIHSYPAKFPAFISEKGLEYVSQRGFRPRIIADIFCGCGTVAYEAKRQGIEFWGCDINPIATLIARVKSNCYKLSKLKEYKEKIIHNYHICKGNENSYLGANERLKYWYSEDSYNYLHRLKQSICSSIPSRSKYRHFFECAFSNILKSTSRWLTKSIKPQIDPCKKSIDVMQAFQKQCDFMLDAFEEISLCTLPSNKIVTANFLSPKLGSPKVDMIITSPPYVTSYEYADLHQLPSLWLGYTDDYRSLRVGSIGSSYQNLDTIGEFEKLSETGKRVVSYLFPKTKSKANSVQKYFLDTQKVIHKSKEMLNSKGYVLMVIGETEYKGVHIENARHIVETMVFAGFEEIEITKRKVTGKILTPYRDAFGKFTTCTESRKIYNEEYIIIGRK